MEIRETERLLLRPIEEADSGFIRGYLSDITTTRYLPRERPYTEAEVAEWLDCRFEHWRRHYFGTFILSVKERTGPVGYCGLEYVRETHFIDIRYSIVPDAWGKGFALEAGFGLLDYGFNQLGCSTIYGAAVPENTPSLNVLKKLGMTSDTAFDAYGSAVLPFSLSVDRYRLHVA